MVRGRPRIQGQWRGRLNQGFQRFETVLVNCLADLAFDDAQRLGASHARAVRSVGCQRVVKVANGDDASFATDRGPAEAKWVALAVEPFVVSGRDWRQIGKNADPPEIS